MRMRAAIETRTTHFFLSLSSALFLFPSLALPQLARTRRTGDGVRAQEFVLKRGGSCKHVSLRRRRRRPDEQIEQIEQMIPTTKQPVIFELNRMESMNASISTS